jgi:predicted acyltransferase
MHSTQTYFTFEDTLTQIGLGYPFLFLLGFRSPRWQWGSFAVILFGYWLAWALYPAPGTHFDYAAVGVSPDWHHNFSGFASHWNKNSNLGNAFDQWFLNLFPRSRPFVANSGGYLTLSFIPTLGTMILGLIAGRWIRDKKPPAVLKPLALAGFAALAIALVLHATGICPIVKRIWTPAWTLFSGGICFFFLAGFTALIEWKGYRRWAFPLVVIGTNSIAAYLLAHLGEDFVGSSLRIHLGDRLFASLGAGLQPLVSGGAILLIYWLMLFWMYRRKIFLKI